MNFYFPKKQKFKISFNSLTKRSHSHSHDAKKNPQIINKPQIQGIKKILAVSSGFFFFFKIK